MATINWTITIRGTGPAKEDDGNASNADRMTAKFAGDLKTAGHEVNAVWLGQGGESDLQIDPDTYPAECRKRDNDAKFAAEEAAAAASTPAT